MQETRLSDELVWARVKQRVRETGRYGYLLGLATVGMAAGAEKVGTPVLLAASAPLALATGAVDPAHAKPVTDQGIIHSGSNRDDMPDRTIARTSLLS